MKKIPISLTALVFLVGMIFSIPNSANATSSFVLPNPVYAAMARPVNEFYVVIWVGDFGETHAPDDVDQGSILVNGSLVPVSVEIAEHAIFGGNALKISVLITEFLPPYGIFWDTAMQNYSVNGSFNDETPFSVEATFISIGHISGDVNGDSRVNIRDLTFMVDIFFRSGPLPAIPQTADVDGSCGALNIQDFTYMVDLFFRGGPAPVHCVQ